MAKIVILLLINVVLSGACALKKTFTVTTVDNATVVNRKEILLSGHDSLEVTNSQYTQKHNITLRDNATLIIRNSSFEHRNDHSFQYQLRAYDNASVIVENSEIGSSDWLNWYFDRNSSLVLRNVKNDQSGIWHVFMTSARATVASVNRFWGTMADNVVFDVADADATFIEFVYPAQASIDEAFPEVITEYIFPNDGERGINTKLTIKNSRASSWGVTINPGTRATIRDTHSLVVTFHLGKPYSNTTAEFSNLKVRHHQDQMWQVAGGDTRLRLINTKTERWSPIVSGNNTLIVKNSEIADNAFSFGDAKTFYENCIIAFLHANDRVHMRIKDSVIDGDVVATGNSLIELIDTTVAGKIVEKESGRVIVMRNNSRKPG